MEKIKAALLHMLLSFVFIGLFVLFIYFIWYQTVFFNISGVLEPIKLLLLVDVILGPLFTLIVYKKNKKGLKKDLSVIVFFQLVAFLYGAYSIHLGKPGLIVHRTGYFEVLTEKYIDEEQLSEDMQGRHSMFYPKYGKIHADSGLNAFSRAVDHLGEITSFDSNVRENYTNPLAPEKVADSVAESSENTQMKFERYQALGDQIFYYDVKFGDVFAVLVIDAATMKFIDMLEI